MSAQRHEPPFVPGMFMRASPPRPRMSCACTIASRAGEANVRRISDHHGSASRTPASSMVRSTSARRSGQRLVPAAHGVVVVGAGVDDALLDVVPRVVDAAHVVGVEAELEHDHARQPEAVAQPLDRRRDHPEVLGDQRQLALQRARRGVEHRAPRPALPAPLSACLARAGTAQ